MARRARKPTSDAARRSPRPPAATRATTPAARDDSPPTPVPSPAPVPSPSSVGNWRAFITAGALVLLTVFAYWNVRNMQFLPLDDQGYVYDNPHVTGGLTAGALRWALTTGDQANWHPVTWLSHMLDVRLFGLDAGFHHLTSLAIHSLNTVLLFFLLLTMTGALGRSACVAALFAVHPLHVESVAWIAERKDVLSTLFWLLTTGAYVWYVRVPGRWRYAAVVCSFALGLMSKPMLVTLPFVLLLLDVWPLGRASWAPARAATADPGDRQAWVRVWLALVREKVPLFVLAAVSSGVTLLVQSRGGAVRSFDLLPIGVRVGNALTSYVMYLVKTIWPSGLAVFYPYKTQIPLWQSCGAFVILAATTSLFIRARRRQPYLLVGWFWYLGTLVPVIGLVQVGTQSMADRYTYVPLIGVFVMVVWALCDAVARRVLLRVALPAVACASVIACTVATRAQVAYWQDAWTLWTRALAVTHDNEAAHIAVGAMLGMRGQNQEAIPHFEEALRINPGSAAAHRALGRALIGLGRFDAAVEALSVAVRREPRSADAQNDLGVALAELGKPAEAIPRFLEALRLEPNRAATHRSVGLALMLVGRAEEASAHLEDALRLEPGSAVAHNDLGFALMTLGRNADAMDHFREALRLEPSFARARDNLGFALAAEGRGAEAIPHLLEAVRLTPDSELAHLHLGMALGAVGRLDEAAREFREVLRMNPGNVDAKRLLDRIAGAIPAGGTPRRSR
jgi:protein O-mannosyl-transferase